jgi:rSAM/selenodomain-associated transferase 1
MKTNALLIFTRNPELGKVKTRLAKTIGNEKALTVYKDLLLHTRNETQAIDCDKFVFYDSEIEENDIWSGTSYQKKLQSNGDLGQRMHEAFKTLFEMGYSNCIIVGSDLFDLKAIIIETAFKELLNYEVVIGPAEDGGYYLLGMNSLHPKIFKNKVWGTASVRKDTLDDLISKKVKLLEIMNDIDIYEDILDIPEIMSTFINTN